MRPVARAHGAPLYFGGALDCFCPRVPQTLATPMKIRKHDANISRQKALKLKVEFLR